MAVFCLGAAAPASSPVSQLSGRYSEHFLNGMVDGSTYWADNIVEVVPVDATHAFVQLSLEFYNGHQCGLSGIATAEGKALVYHEPADGVAEGKCHLSLTHAGTKLGIDDDGGSCSVYCGARGTLSGIGLPWKSKRPITYLPQLKASHEYTDALAAWRKTKDGQ
ncbi:hypothetical protein [Sphingomonas sp. PR090111-T3T-6A]|uniref:hypothetical protein n=1 Tax=Sphingomonas sp. PR090111-T3T-6A TaxID=685778 RepID=UPI0012F7279C|nr:hypothetical protein [Sphingomonas sp. PR090111-T3T-6A]